MSRFGLTLIGSPVYDRGFLNCKLFLAPRQNLAGNTNVLYYKGSYTAITTNKGIVSWPSVLADDEVLAGAILDRLLHRATVLNIQGRSYRLKELDTQLSEHTSTTTVSSQEPAHDAEQFSVAVALTSALRPVVEGLCEGDGGGGLLYRA